ncbi:MAG: SMI1/KNR4 family protein [Nocardioidaceae bacterium]
MPDLARIRRLVFGAVRAPEERLVGATPKQLISLQERVGRPLPEELLALLSICNGAAIGPGGLFGERPDAPYLDLPSIRALFPEWDSKGWMPVAGDGCGNYFVLLTDGRVGFVDTMSDPSALASIEYGTLFEFVEAILVGDQAAP